MAESDSGVMPLMDHLRELRRRLLIAVVAILIGTIVGWIAYPQVFEFVKQPYIDGIAPLLKRSGFDATLVLSGGIGSAFTFRLKVALVLGLLLSSPVWVWESWAFVLPASTATKSGTELYYNSVPHRYFRQRPLQDSNLGPSD